MDKDKGRKALSEFATRARADALALSRHAAAAAGDEKPALEDHGLDLADPAVLEQRSRLAPLADDVVDGLLNPDADGARAEDELDTHWSATAASRAAFAELHGVRSYPIIRKWLGAFAVTGNKVRACAMTNVSRARVQGWVDSYPAFRVVLAIATEVAADRLEAEARRRAEEGVLKPVYQKGIIVGYERVYSDSLMIALLQADRPERFATRSKVDASVTPRARTDETLDLTKYTDAELAQLEALLAKGRT